MDLDLSSLADRHPVGTGFAGMVATFSASTISALQDLDLFCRVGCSVCGLLIGILTVAKLWSSGRKPGS